MASEAAYLTPKLLILDLDETLFHATQQPLSIRHDFMLEQYHIYLRPCLAPFLTFCHTHFQLAVWTSSTADYAEAIVQRIFPAPEELLFLWHREQCIHRVDSSNYEPVYIKDLKKVKRKGFNLDHVIALDDSPEKLQRNYGNLLRVKPFYGSPEDDELSLLMPCLEQLKKAQNIRRVEKRGWSGHS